MYNITSKEKVNFLLSLVVYLDMEDYKYETEGAPVIFSSRQKESPVNPLNRPNVTLKKPLIYIAGYIVLILVFLFIGLHFFSGIWIATGIVLISLISFIIFGKRAAIWAIHYYQKKAPDEVRLRCVFSPSCSEYMILAIEKYGLFSGIAKGIDRLLRCHDPNGGIDLP